MSEADAGATTGTVSIGHPIADQVLQSLDSLNDRPLSEHHDILADAHDRLHRLLTEDDEVAR